MAKIHEIMPGRRPGRDDYNRLAKEVNRIAKITGRNGIRVNSTPSGISLVGSVSTAADGSVRKSFAQTDASSAAGSTISCWLNETDSAGDTITVNCSIAGGSNLSSAIPYITDGDMMPVFQDSAADWWCTTIFTRMDICT